MAPMSMRAQAHAGAAAQEVLAKHLVVYVK